MNSTNIIGNLTKDVELKYTQNNKVITTVTLAVNEGYGDNQKTYFIDVQAWEKQAENLVKYCGKGSKIAVTGKLIQQTWEHEGKKLSKVLIQAFNVMFLDTKTKDDIKKEKTDHEILRDAMQDPYAEFENEISSQDLPF